MIGRKERTQRPAGHVEVVRLIGDVDACTSGRIRQLILKALEQGNYRALVDLRYVAYIDSSGISALISGLRAAREKGGDLVLSGCSPRLENVINLTGLDKLFRIFPEEGEAIRALQRDWKST